MTNRVKELRVSRRMTQIYLATCVGCSQNTISKIELGNTEAKESLIIAIADFFNVSTDYLLMHSNYQQTVEANIKIGNMKDEVGKISSRFNLLDDNQIEIINLLIDEFIEQNGKSNL